MGIPRHKITSVSKRIPSRNRNVLIDLAKSAVERVMLLGDWPNTTYPKVVIDSTNTTAKTNKEMAAMIPIARILDLTSLIIRRGSLIGIPNKRTLNSNKYSTP